jgi:hypothetical protein
MVSVDSGCLQSRPSQRKRQSSENYCPLVASNLNAVEYFETTAFKGLFDPYLASLGFPGTAAFSTAAAPEAAS